MGVKLESVAFTVVSVLPVTGLWSAGTVEPYDVSKPYSKVTVVDSPLALTVPFKVAPELLIPEAVSVVAEGTAARTGTGDNPVIKTDVKIAIEAIVINLFRVCLLAMVMWN